jgi:hypothetical protein
LTAQEDFAKKGCWVSGRFSMGFPIPPSLATGCPMFYCPLEIKVDEPCGSGGFLYRQKAYLATQVFDALEPSLEHTT